MLDHPSGDPQVESVMLTGHLAGSLCGHEFCFLCLRDYHEIRSAGNRFHSPSCKYHPDNLPSLNDRDEAADDGGPFYGWNFEYNYLHDQEAADNHEHLHDRRRRRGLVHSNNSRRITTRAVLLGLVVLVGIAIYHRFRKREERSRQGEYGGSRRRHEVHRRDSNERNRRGEYSGTQNRNEEYRRDGDAWHEGIDYEHSEYNSASDFSDSSSTSDSHRSGNRNSRRRKWSNPFKRMRRDY